VLNRVLSRQLSAGEAAEVSHLLVRQVRQTLAAHREASPGAMAHGNRCRMPVNTVAQGVCKQVTLRRLAA